MSRHLTSGQHTLLKAALELRQQELGKQLADHLHGLTRAERARDVFQQDADDAPQRRPEQEIAMALSDRERREMDAITASLNRMQRGDYGVCPDCGADIPFDRLKAEPWALRCVACESRHERARP